MKLRHLILTAALCFGTASGAQSNADKDEAYFLLNSPTMYTDSWYSFVAQSDNPYLRVGFDDPTFAINGNEFSESVAIDICWPDSYDALQAMLRRVGATVEDALRDLGCYISLGGYPQRLPNSEIPGELQGGGWDIVRKQAFVGPVSLYQAWLRNKPDVAFEVMREEARAGRIDLLDPIFNNTASFTSMEEFVPWLHSENAKRFQPAYQLRAHRASFNVQKANWMLCRVISGTTIWRATPGRKPRDASELLAPNFVDAYNTNCVESNWGWGVRADMEDALGRVREVILDQLGLIVENDIQMEPEKEAALLSRVQDLLNDDETPDIEHEYLWPTLTDRPIDVVIRANAQTITEVLLDAGAPTDHRDKLGSDPLTGAIIAGMPASIIEKIIANGASLTRRYPTDPSDFSLLGGWCFTQFEGRLGVTMQLNALDYAFCRYEWDAVRVIASNMRPQDVNCLRVDIAMFWRSQGERDRDLLGELRDIMNAPDLCS